MQEKDKNTTQRDAPINNLTEERASKSNAIDIPSISLPKGGGAIKGIDEKFQVNPSNGTASFSIPVPLAPNRNGFTPALAVSYNSGAGNSILGIGWGLDFPSIVRKTDKRLPRYLDDSGQEDTFMFSGAEDLVPALKEEDGRWIPDFRTENGYTIRRYRPRVEGLFARIERIQHATHGMYWRVTTRENVTTIFGRRPDCRIADPEDVRRIFQWLPEMSFDDKGSVVLFEYKAEDGVDIPDEIWENNRRNVDGSLRFVNRYLKRIKYGNERPLFPYDGAPSPYDPIMPESVRWFFESVLDYGDHNAGRPGPEADGSWPGRPDPYSDYRAGFEIRTHRLLRRALLFHRFAELNDGMPTLVRSLDFKYFISDNAERERETELEFLEHIFQTSYVWDGANNRYHRRSLPPLSFEYQPLHWNQEVKNVGQEDLVHAPAGLTNGYQFTDLYNEGISGILTEQGNGWHYKHNLGDPDGDGLVTFAPAKLVAPKPSFTGLSGGVLQLQDLDADGSKQIVVTGEGIQGYFELDDEDTWQVFQPFLNMTSADLSDPNVRLLDLDGDGKPEIVLTEENAFRWWPNKGREGFDAAERAFKPYEEEHGPAIVFSDPEQRIFLADMSGDGLTDIVRIRNGEVCYWPNLGYGRFGRKVAMGNAPWFDTQDHFNPAYLQLADISGTGASDLIYLGKNRFSAWLNLGGNRWGKAQAIDPFFPTGQPNQITVTDLLGQGTGCLVWSSPLPENAGSPLRYMDLMGGKKPHIMTAYHNNLGKTVRMEYRSSTWFYLKDKRAGKPWITRLPFPVQVVEKTVSGDKWRNTRFASTYSYHHGYYDHAEREFRGFGRVEQTDVEDFGIFEKGNADSPYITTNQTLYQPPVRTLTWFHTGAFLSREKILGQFEHEYFPAWAAENGFTIAGDFAENTLPEPDVAAQNLSALEYREALRACKGMALRTETYELAVNDTGHVTDRRVRLFGAAMHNCHIQCLQRRDENAHAVFLATESEAITYNYELDLQQSELNPDPRISHSLILQTDDLGNALQSVAVAYSRWEAAAFDDPLLPAGAETLIRSIQAEMHIAHSENRFTNDVVNNTDYRLRMPCEVITNELTGFTLPDRQRYFSLEDFRKYRLSAVHQHTGLTVPEIAYHVLPDRTAPQKRTVERMQMRYFQENLLYALPLGSLHRLGLPFETYQLALTDDLLQAVLGDKLPSLQQAGESPAAMRTRVLLEGGYHQFAEEPRNWWIRSGTAGFQSDAAEHFCLPERYTDPFGAVTTLTFDRYDLFMERSEDQLGNRVEVLRFDYRVLAPLEMKDPNHNLSEVAFDVLGMPVAMALKGKGSEGDIVGVTSSHPDNMAEQIAFFTGDYDENKARELLGTATARYVYYLGETVAPDGSILYGRHPACAAGIVREKHVAQLAPGETSPIQIAFEYSDGGGAVISKKVQAEPETDAGLLRWITNGKTILNNKGKPVKQYEPYFTGHHRYEEPAEMGVTPILYYDAAGRTVRTEMPDGTFSRVEFSPWHFRAFDANDTILDSRWFRDRSGNPAWDETAVHPPADPDQRAAFLAKIHADTPAETHTDSLGREVVAIAHNRRRKPQGNDFLIAEEKYLSYTKMDAEGKPLWLQDARGNYVMVYARVQNPADFQNMNVAVGYTPAYDIAGNLLFQHSNEAGDRRMLPDATGQPMYVWDENEYAGAPEQRLMRSEYDALRRPTRQWLRIDFEAEKEIGRTVYGESVSNPEAGNLRGQPVISLGPEGRTEALRFDFKGNLLEGKRQLLADATVHTMDWSTFSEGVTSSPPLTNEVFLQKTDYDALNRMIRLENWHREDLDRTPGVYVPTYNRRGVLESEILSVRGQTMQAIRKIGYDAKGQRTRIRYGNDTTTRYDYDPNTFRLTRLLTTANNGTQILQDLHYNYDPTGNIAQIQDDAQDDLYFANRQVKPIQHYEYDALYRLIRAKGREHIRNGPPDSGNYPETNIASIPNPDPHAVREYEQVYEYDAAGNFTTLQHLAEGGAWTRHYETETANNRLRRTWLGSDEANAVTYRYDTHGSMLNFARILPEHHNRWDYRDMIHTLDLEGGGTAYYQYDAQKQRTRKRIVRNTTEYWERLYLGGYELYRRYVNGTLQEETETHHLFADDQRILVVEDEIIKDSFIIHHSSLFRYQYGNHLGSVGLECDEQARIISYEEFHPYGTTAYEARNGAITAAAKRYRYTGMERDEESGLAYHTARYYLAWLGRWGSCDPIGVKGGENVYLYVLVNPLLNKDLEGTDVYDDSNKLLEGVRTSVSGDHGFYRGTYEATLAEAQGYKIYHEVTGKLRDHHGNLQKSVESASKRIKEIDQFTRKLREQDIGAYRRLLPELLEAKKILEAHINLSNRVFEASKILKERFGNRLSEYPHIPGRGYTTSALVSEQIVTSTGRPYKLIPNGIGEGADDLMDSIRRTPLNENQVRNLFTPILSKISQKATPLARRAAVETAERFQREFVEKLAKKTGTKVFSFVPIGGLVGEFVFADKDSTTATIIIRGVGSEIGWSIFDLTSYYDVMMVGVKHLCEKLNDIPRSPYFRVRPIH